MTRTLAANASTTLTLTLPDSQFGFPSTAQPFLDGAPLGTSALFAPCAAPKHAEQTVRSGVNTTLEPDCPFHGIFTLTTPAEHGTVHLVPSIETEGFVVQYQSRQGYVGPDQLVVFCHDATPGVAPFYATISLTVVAAPTTTASNRLPSSSSPSNSSPSRPAPASPAAQTQGVTLAATGAGTGPTIALGVGLVIAGLALTWAARQRHRRAH